MCMPCACCLLHVPEYKIECMTCVCRASYWDFAHHGIPRVYDVYTTCMPCVWWLLHVLHMACACWVSHWYSTYHLVWHEHTVLCFLWHFLLLVVLRVVWCVLLCVCDYVCVILCGMTASYVGCANVFIFATHCTTRSMCNTLYHTAPHYTTHTAPHSNTPQHTATVLCRCRKHGVTVGVRGRVVVESCSIFENTEHGIMAHAASSSLLVNRSR